jgi:hypothetical protein
MTWVAEGKSGKVAFSDFQVDQPVDAAIFAAPPGAVPMTLDKAEKGKK